MNLWNWIIIGASFCGLYVVLGAFGAHGLESKLSAAQMNTYQTGLRYMVIHGLALIILNYIGLRENLNTAPSNYLMLIGIFLFSISLLVHSCKDILGIPYNAFAMVAPLGGLSYVAGWIAFIINVVRR